MAVHSFSQNAPSITDVSGRPLTASGHPLEARASQKTGQGRAAGAGTAVPAASTGDLPSTNFDPQSYLALLAGTVSEVAGDEQAEALLGEMSSALGEIIDSNQAEGDTAPVYSSRAKDLMALISQVMNLERGLKIQQISNHALNNINKLKEAAKEMREAANDIEKGAIIAVVLSVTASVVSMAMSGMALKSAKEAKALANSKSVITKDLTKASGKLDRAGLHKMKAATPQAREGIQKTIQNHQQIVDGLKSQRAANAELGKASSAFAESLGQIAQGAATMGGSFGKFGESMYQAESKRKDADVAEMQADAQLEQATKETMQQALNSIKTMIEALMNAYREIRDTQDQVKANIARNA